MSAPVQCKEALSNVTTQPRSRGFPRERHLDQPFDGWE